MNLASPNRIVVSALWIAATAGLAPAQDQMRRVSSNPAGDPGSDWSLNPVISTDGRFVAFTSLADDLVPNDTNQAFDVFVFDRIAGTMERASLTDGGAESTGGGYTPVISADGRFVAFTSGANDLIPGDTNHRGDVYVRDRVAGTTTIVSVATSGTQGNDDSEASSISADGTRIAFTSTASDLVPGDSNGDLDVFVRDMVAGTTTLVSVTQAGVIGDGSSKTAAISADGKHVSFASTSTNFPNYTGPRLAPYVKDLDTGNLERIDADSNGGFPTLESQPTSMTDDGSIVAFSTSVALVPEDTNGSSDAYIRDRARGVTERVSFATGGGQVSGAAWPWISGDGRFVSFIAYGDDATSDDHNGFPDLVVRDCVLGISTLVSKGTLDERITHDVILQPNGDIRTGRWISDDGSQIVFLSDTADLVAGDTTGLLDIFLRSLDRHPATSTHYGSGWPGTGAVIPTMDPVALPYRGTRLDVDITNSSGAATTAFVFIGYARSDVPTNLGGSLLVDWTTLFAVPLPVTGFTLTGGVPTDYWANGLVIDLQTVELDPGASRGVSFTDGLELVLGDV